MRWQQKKLCCFYVSTLMSHVVVVGYGKGVLETGFQLCQTMMLCTSVCVCASPFVYLRSLTLSLHRSPVLLLFFFLFFCARLHRLLLSHTHIHTLSDIRSWISMAAHILIQWQIIINGTTFFISNKNKHGYVKCCACADDAMLLLLLPLLLLLMM